VWVDVKKAEGGMDPLCYWDRAMTTGRVHQISSAVTAVDRARHPDADFERLVTTDTLRRRDCFSVINQALSRRWGIVELTSVSE
jgi:hypothetical protein